ncbi:MULTISPECIES: hypothetical protein [unclassified Pedobacter]|uniref:hypothetical protein n=1 Tax=unclassified Pedobacter TaxID=2628915 RepID=UPI001E414A57|nr:MULTISPECIES: hypothetical protein [unclassified Pedobacter]
MSLVLAIKGTDVPANSIISIQNGATAGYISYLGISQVHFQNTINYIRFHQTKLCSIQKSCKIQDGNNPTISNYRPLNLWR